MANIKRNTKGNLIPLVVTDCLECLEQRNALRSEGIFRVSGSSKEIKKLMKTYNKGGRADLHRVDVHTVAALLKGYLNDNKTEPLFSINQVEAILLSVEINDQSDRLQYLKRIFADITSPYREILHKLLPFLSRICELSEENKMDSKNLAKIYGPILLRRKLQAPQDLFKWLPVMVDVVSTILLHSSSILEGWDDIVTEQPKGPQTKESWLPRLFHFRTQKTDNNPLTKKKQIQYRANTFKNLGDYQRSAIFDTLSASSPSSSSRSFESDLETLKKNRNSKTLRGALTDNPTDLDLDLDQLPSSKRLSRAPTPQEWMTDIPDINISQSFPQASALDDLDFGLTPPSTARESNLRWCTEDPIFDIENKEVMDEISNLLVNIEITESSNHDTTENDSESASRIQVDVEKRNSLEMLPEIESPRKDQIRRSNDRPRLPIKIQVPRLSLDEVKFSDLSPEKTPKSPEKSSELSSSNNEISPKKLESKLPSPQKEPLKMPFLTFSSRNTLRNPSPILISSPRANASLNSILNNSTFINPNTINNNDNNDNNININNTDNNSTMSPRNNIDNSILCNSPKNNDIPLEIKPLNTILTETPTDAPATSHLPHIKETGSFTPRGTAPRKNTRNRNRPLPVPPKTVDTNTTSTSTSSSSYIIPNPNSLQGLIIPEVKIFNVLNDTYIEEDLISSARRDTPPTLQEVSG